MAWHLEPQRDGRHWSHCPYIDTQAHRPQYHRRDDKCRGFRARQRARLGRRLRYGAEPWIPLPSRPTTRCYETIASAADAGIASPVSYTHLRAHETRHDLV